MILMQSTPSTIELIQDGWFNGIAPNIPSKIYHAAPGLSFSGMKHLEYSPAHYQGYLRAEFEESLEMRIGSLTHLGTLEPERYLTDVVLIEGNGNSKEVKDAIAAAKLAGKEIYRKADEKAQVEGMIEAIMSHAAASALLRNGLSEQSVFWTDPETGVLLKCRPDYLRASEGVVIDLKTTQSKKLVTRRSIEGHIKDFRYHWQSGHYLDGVSVNMSEPLRHFAHVCVGREPTLYLRGKLTYPVRVVELDDASLEAARMEYRPLIRKFAECKKTGEWPGPTEDIETVALPAWAWPTDQEIL